MHMNIKVGIIVVAVSLCTLNFFKKNTVLNLCDIEKCPACFGTNLCKAIEQNQIQLKYTTLLDVIYNFISIKNVYFAKFNHTSVVLKKLAHSTEIILHDERLKRIQSDNYTQLIMDQLNKNSDNNSVTAFKTCGYEISARFLRELRNLNVVTLRNIISAIFTNVEPLILQIFPKEKGWPVPHLYGFCGQIVVVEDCGEPLNQFERANWLTRAYLARQLLNAALKFTFHHEYFRLYLTDISPDNIAVNEALSIHFVDLEHGILHGNYEYQEIHETQHSTEEDYTYSEDDICSKNISDHNIYSVCHLLLSKNAPWPMMKGGLLHSPPNDIVKNYTHLFQYIELCVNLNHSRSNRFTIARKIVSILEELI